MIIHLEGAAEHLDTARGNLESMASGWGYQLRTEPPTAPTPARPGNKGIDPISVAALALSIPSVALAVLDLADRIQKRRRAYELIDQSRQLAERHITVYLITPSQHLELALLDSDELLELITDEEKQNH